MEQKLSDILDNVLGLLLLEGSYDIQETDAGFEVMIETPDAGRLIGFKGEALSSLQLLTNQMVSKGQKDGEFKRVIIDVSGWRSKKEDELKKKATEWGNEVLESGKEMELEPMPSWQRRIIHMTIQEMNGLSSESVGEGKDRHLVIGLAK